MNNKDENILEMNEVEFDGIECLEDTNIPALGGLCGIGCVGAICGLWC